MSSAEKGWPVYRPQEIEPKWQANWEHARLYLASELVDKPKYYCLDFFPYPSGDGLHVGHCRNYMPTDVIARYKRMRGYNVLHPMGWDAFGEPTEQYAILHNIHPIESTRQNTTNFRQQLTLIGNGYDWSREITSSDPEFYRWTQWFFLVLYRRGLAYRDTNWQWWCPVCQTTLSSHEAAGGVCWRGHGGVTKREIPAWYFRITAYADALLDDLEEIDWPEPIKLMQRNWIGRSQGYEIIFRTESGHPLPVFTTRPDTIYGVTFFVLAPEHPLVEAITNAEQKTGVTAYAAAAVRQSEIERSAEARPKTGIFTGGYVINPLNSERVPVWVADYVLPGYGSGAVMGVPAHDERDYDFAHLYGLPIKAVIKPEGDPHSAGVLEQAYTGDGWMIDSGSFSGLHNRAGMQAIGQFLLENGLGGPKVQYHMRDWVISRQRYWGTPIPVVHCSKCGIVPLSEEQLPVRLPELDDFRPDESGKSPLARLIDFVNTECPSCGGPAERETDTMGGFACSSWYFLRFSSPHHQDGPFDPQAVKYWLPVDLYVGGAEHAVLHLLYARFWTKVMADEGLLPFNEPFIKLVNQGQLLGPDGQRMSKSRGNVITPDAVVASHGADALRIYEMFMAPFEQDIQWSTEGLSGARRFLNRLWQLYRNTYTASAGCTGWDPGLERQLHITIRNVSERIEGFRFNTMVSALMEFLNLLQDHFRNGSWQNATFHQSLEILLLLLAPVAPHIAEELWSLTGHSGSVHQQPWPAWDSELTQEELVQIAVQVNGKLRQVIEVAAQVGQTEVETLAMEQAKVQPYIAGKQITRIIFIPGKVLNIVVREPS